MLIANGVLAANNLFAFDAKPRHDARRQHGEENTLLRYAIAILITLASVTTGHTAELKVLAALVLQDALGRIVPGFSRDGRTVEIGYSTVGAIRQRLAAGERADVVV